MLNKKGVDIPPCLVPIHTSIIACFTPMLKISFHKIQSYEEQMHHPRVFCIYALVVLCQNFKLKLN